MKKINFLTLKNKRAEKKQRQQFGISESDTWSLNTYLSQVIANGLQHLANNSNGWSNLYRDYEEMRMDYLVMAEKFRNIHIHDDNPKECLEWFVDHFETLWD